MFASYYKITTCNVLDLILLAEKDVSDGGKYCVWCLYFFNARNCSKGPSYLLVWH